jgi:hypothetical protein
MIASDTAVRIDFKKLTIAAFSFGFVLIPVHELGHVICDRLTGHPATMSYARDRLLSGGETPFLGLLGGPLLPTVVAAVAIAFILKGTNVSVLYPVAIQASIERLALYVLGGVPSDERDLARLAGWNAHSFRSIFLVLEISLLVLVVISMRRNKLGAKSTVLVFAIAVVCLVVSALFGVLVVERLVFPEQYRIQFG